MEPGSLYKNTEAGDVAKVSMLLQMGMDPQSPHEHGREGWSCLHVAALKGAGKLVGVLLEWGAKVDDVTARGATPLHFASSEGHSHVVEKLIAAGADVFCKTVKGEQPRDTAKRMLRMSCLTILDERRREVENEEKAKRAALAARQNLKRGVNECIRYTKDALERGDVSLALTIAAKGLRHEPEDAWIEKEPAYAQLIQLRTVAEKEDWIIRAKRAIAAEAHLKETLALRENKLAKEKELTVRLTAEMEALKEKSFGEVKRADDRAKAAEAKAEELDVCVKTQRACASKIQKVICAGCVGVIQFEVDEGAVPGTLLTLGTK